MHNTRKLVAIIEVDENIASRNSEVNGIPDSGTVEYVEREFGWLVQSGIQMKDCLIVDEDDDIVYGRYINYLTEWIFEHSSDDVTHSSPKSFDEWKKAEPTCYFDEQLDLKEGEPHYKAAMYVKENGLYLIDFDFWANLEDILGFEISFEDYSRVDKAIEEDLLELTDKDRDRIVEALGRDEKGE